MALRDARGVLAYVTSVDTEYNDDDWPLCQTPAEGVAVFEGKCGFTVINGFCWNEHNHVPPHSPARLPVGELPDPDEGT